MTPIFLNPEAAKPFLNPEQPSQTQDDAKKKSNEVAKRSFSALGPAASQLAKRVRVVQKQCPLGTFPLQPLPSGEIKQVHYVLCNEGNQIEVLNQLANEEKPTQRQRVHMGFSCWFNFDLMAERKSSMGIICDIDPNIIYLLDLFKKTILSSETPKEFTEALWTNLGTLENADFIGTLLDYEGSKDLASFQEAYLNRGWLKNQENFDHIKHLYQENKIVHRELDIRNSESFQKIENWLNTQDLRLDTFYDSNIPEWVQSKEKTLQENVQKVIHEDTHVLTAQTKVKGQGTPQLSLTKGKHPKLKYVLREKTTTRLIKKNSPIIRKLKF